MLCETPALLDAVLWEDDAEEAGCDAELDEDETLELDEDVVPDSSPVEVEELLVLLELLEEDELLAAGTETSTVLLVTVQSL